MTNEEKLHKALTDLVEALEDSETAMIKADVHLKFIHESMTCPGAPECPLCNAKAILTETDPEPEYWLLKKPTK